MSCDDTALRGYLARILGWSVAQAPAVESALQAIALAITYRAALVLLGDFDLVPIAHALHRRALGAERPFVVADPRRPDGRATVRSPASRPSGVAALDAARGGTLCARLRRLPGDFSEVIARARDPDADVRIVICADARYDRHPFLAVPPPIRLPPLTKRAGDLERIVDKYALDAIRELGADEAGFTDADRRWVLRHAAATLPAIETETLRLVALRTSPSMTQAAERLGMTGAALWNWCCRRRRAGAAALHQDAEVPDVAAEPS